MQNYNNQFMYLQGKITNSNKFYGFDLDGTLIVYRDGHDPVRYNTVEPNNWQFLGKVKEKLLELSKEYTIIIITNQFNLSENKRIMIENIWRMLDCIPFVLCANKKNEFRKPNTGFLNVIKQMIPSVNFTESYYSGDAVGESDCFIPYKWSSDDFDFSRNCGLKFSRQCDIFSCSNVIPTQDIVIMVGNPGSCKTTFSKLLEQNFGYTRFSQDEIGKLETKIQIIKNELLIGKKVVLDATFAKLENRMHFLMLAKELNKSVMIAWVIRDGRCWNRLRTEPVSHFAYDGKFGYTKNFNDPEIIPEGYNYILEKIY